MIRVILVPVDGSAFGENALPLAMSLAEKAEATLQVLHVHQPALSFYGSFDMGQDMTLDAKVRSLECEYLSKLSKRLKEASPVPITCKAHDGQVDATLLYQASLLGANLIVMSTHGHGPVSRFWLGGVADKLIRHTSVPVLLVRPGETEADLRSKPGISNVLIPLDGSELAEQILEPAIELGKLLGATFTLVRAVEPIIVPDYNLGGFAVGGIDPVLVSQLQVEALNYLDGMAKKLRERSLNVKTVVKVNQTAASAILAQAKSQKAGLIAMATQGRSGFARLLIGSVADKVLRGAMVPVLVLRPIQK
jgi:nucleotide-binding universal stress UspA family protein